MLEYNAEGNAAMTIDIRQTRHPFLDGKLTRMPIDGKWPILLNNPVEGLRGY